MPKLRPEGSPGTIECEWKWAKLEEPGCLKGQRIKGAQEVKRNEPHSGWLKAIWQAERWGRERECWVMGAGEVSSSWSMTTHVKDQWASTEELWAEESCDRQHTMETVWRKHWKPMGRAFRPVFPCQMELTWWGAGYWGFGWWEVIGA